MVIELRDKLNDFTAQSSAERISSGARPKLPADAVFDDALSALINLGYQRNAAEKALKQAVKDGTEMSVQKLLRKSLQLLAKDKYEKNFPVFVLCCLFSDGNRSADKIRASRRLADT